MVTRYLLSQNTRWLFLVQVFFVCLLSKWQLKIRKEESTITTEKNFHFKLQKLTIYTVYPIVQLDGGSSCQLYKPTFLQNFLTNTKSNYIYMSIYVYCRASQGQMVTGSQILQLELTRSKVILKGPKTPEKYRIHIVSLTYTVNLFSAAYIPSLLTLTAVLQYDCDTWNCHSIP